MTAGSFTLFPLYLEEGHACISFNTSKAFVAPTTVGRTRPRLLNLLSRLSCPTPLHRAHQASQRHRPPRLSTNTGQQERSLCSSWPSAFPPCSPIPREHLSLSSLDLYTTGMAQGTALLPCFPRSAVSTSSLNPCSSHTDPELLLLYYLVSSYGLHGARRPPPRAFLMSPSTKRRC